MRLELGCPVRCSDGMFGELGDVVIDPTRRRVTHLVVQPLHEHAKARLVPVGLARPANTMEPEIVASCTLAEMRRLPLVQEFAYLRVSDALAADPDWEIGVHEVFALPYYTDPAPPEADAPVAMTYDRVPKGSIELRRSSSVMSADGHRVGHVDGFIVDSEDEITHLVLDHGHLWGRREVTIPINAVARVESDAAILGLSKDEVGALEQVPVRRWTR